MKRTTALGVAAGAALATTAVAARRRALADRSVVLGERDAPTRTDELGGTDHVVLSHDGAELVAHVTGPADGQVVVLAHCWAGSQRTWAPVTRRLVGEGLRVVRWDQRGHGRSGVGHKGHTIEGLADDLACVLADLDLHDAVLVGHSMGGMTVQAFAAHHPDVLTARARALVLVATAGFDIGRGGRRDRPEVVALPITDRIMSSPGIGALLVRNAFGHRAHPDHVDATRHDFAVTAGPVRAELLASMQQLDLRHHLGGIELPTTVLVGSRDRLTPVRLSKGLADTIPGAELVVLEGRGHMLPFEAPDEIAEAVLVQVATPASVGA